MTTVSDWKDLALGRLFAAAGFAAPIAAFFENRAVAPIVIATAVIGLFLLLSRGQRPSWPPGALLAVLGGLVLWAGVSVLWSLDTLIAARGVGKLTGNLAAGIVLYGLAGRLAPRERAMALKGLMWGAGIAALGIFSEFATGGAYSLGLMGRGINEAAPFFWFKGCVLFVMLAGWPLAGRLLTILPPKGWPRNSIVIVIGLIVVLLVSMMALLKFETGLLAIGLSVAAAFGVWFLGRHLTRLLALVIALLIVMAPLIPLHVLDADRFAAMSAMPKPALHRLYIWRFAGERIVEKPITGWGMNAARIIPGGKDRVVDKFRGDYGPKLPLHPHNFALQIWLELGLPGALLAALFTATLLWRLGRGGNGAKLPRALAVGHFVAGLTLLGIGIGIWQSWFIGTLWFNAAFSRISLAPEDAAET